MRIAVRKLLFADKHAALRQQRDDGRIRFEDSLALVLGQTFDKAAVVIERSVGFESIFLAGCKVFRAVAGSGVHNSTALIQGDVVGEHSRHAQLLKKRMLKLHAFEFASLSNFREWSARFEPQQHSQLRVAHSFFREQELACGTIHDNVFVVRMKRESAVRRQRPWRCGPDQRADISANPELPGFLAGNNRKLHPDRRAGVVFVFHFRFGQSGAVINAPVHRLQSPVNVALFEKC